MPISRPVTRFEGRTRFTSTPRQAQRLPSPPPSTEERLTVSQKEATQEGEPTYRLAGIEITSAEFNTYNRATDRGKFDFLVKKGIIPTGSQFVESITPQQVADIRAKSKEGIELGIVPAADIEGITAKGWGYYDPAQVAEFKAYMETRPGELRQYMADVKKARERIQKETAIARREAIDVRLTNVIAFTDQKQFNAMVKFNNTVNPYAIATGQPFKNNYTRDDLVKYLIRNPGDTKTLLTAGFNSADIGTAKRYADKFATSESEFLKILPSAQRGWITYALGRKYKDTPWSRLTKTQKSEILAYFSIDIKDIQAASVQALKEALIIPALIENPPYKGKTEVRRAGAVAIPMAGITASTPIAAAAVAGLLVDANIRATESFIRSVQNKIEDYRDKYGVYPTASQVSIDINGRTTTLDQISKTIPVTIDTRTPGFTPLTLETKLPGITPTRIGKGDLKLIPPTITTKLTGMVPKVLDTTIPGITGTNIGKGSIIASAAVTTKERVKWVFPIVNYPVRGGAGAPGLAYYAAQNLTDLDNKLYEAYVNGAVSREQYDDYQAARKKYLLSKGAVSETTVAGNQIYIRGIGRIDITPIITPATAAALRASQQARESGLNATQTTQLIELSANTAAGTATAALVDTLTQTQTLTPRQTALLTATVVNTATATAVNTATMEATAEMDTTTTTGKAPPLKFPLPEEVSPGVFKMPKGTVTWRQGIGWWSIYPPYGAEQRKFTIKKPEGSQIVGDAKGAYDTIQTIKGLPPGKIAPFDMGIVDVEITKPPQSPRAGNRAAIRFTRDTGTRQPSNAIRNRRVGQYYVARGMVSRRPIGRRNKPRRDTNMGYGPISEI